MKNVWWEFEPRREIGKAGNRRWLDLFPAFFPAEAKGGEDKSAPSFKKYVSTHQPEYAIRFSKRGYRKDGYIANLPLYLEKTRELFSWVITFAAFVRHF